MKKQGHENNLIRIHPKDSGKTIEFEGETFIGVSPDVFIGLDLLDYSEVYCTTRKFNISIQINPTQWPSADFFKKLTNGELKKTKKCTIHGDYDTGLRASEFLMSLLQPGDLNRLDESSFGFKVNNVRYFFDSVGIAANENYAGVGDRNTSHFEIKFLRESMNSDLKNSEYLCLNIHLSANLNANYDECNVVNRLRQGIRLFYAELGVLMKHEYQTKTCLQDSLLVTTDDYESKGFSCIHPESNEAHLRYQLARKKTVSSKQPLPPLQLGNFFSSNTATKSFFSSKPINAFSPAPEPVNNPKPSFLDVVRTNKSNANNQPRVNPKPSSLDVVSRTNKSKVNNQPGVITDTDYPRL